ncbi:MAG: phasin family protein [Gammaproteobacteria bacterium]|nr:phasin family protein [Gammaproteobacteria bacterium]
MSSDKHDKHDRASELAKNVWLAGLGAYGKAFDVAADKYSSASKDAPKLFNELVEKGAELEQHTRDQLARPLSTPKVAIEERIEKMRTYLGINAKSAAKQDEVERLEKKVGQLERKLAKLAKQLEQGG